MSVGSLSSGARRSRQERTGNLLTTAQAATVARLALANVEREFPNKLDHVMAGTTDVAPPRALHPAFFGSFDWHSCVHAHWLLARILRLQADVVEAALIRGTLESHLSAANVAAEVEYFRRPESRTFERSYGWAWLLKLAAELGQWSDVDAQRWSRNLAPLAQAVAGAYLDWLPDATYPIRHGVHSNTAFALAFAHDYAGSCAATALGELVVAKAREWYLGDIDAPARWEPSGADFFSPTLIEADLMRRILDPSEFPDWLARFLPGIERREPRTLFSPAVVSNRSDPYIVHLDGLNLSRAWCWRAIAGALPRDDRRATIATAAADAHRAAGMIGVASGEYVGDHWLATFAVLALTT
ncbi:MAG: DUF2891 domain-containing protein [Betaproteobacteria bacterium]|nr:MAG: DUF2891 domain-containing protein [Betaproteobacteria bacterium]